MKYIKHLVLTFLLFLLLTSTALAADLVNITVYNADVRDVLTALASVGGVNIVADDSVTGKITLDLVDIPFDTALDIVTRTKGLAYQKIDNVIIVATLDKISKGFATVQVITLDFANAEDVKKSLVGIIAEDRLKVDAQTNSLIFSGSPGETAQIRKVISSLDIPFKQISLEAKVVSINDADTKDLGVDWTWQPTPTYPTYTPPTFTTTYDNNGNPTGQIQTAPATVTRPTNTGVIQFGLNPEGVPYEFQYQAQISALITKNKAKILAKPNITTINGKEASILIGERIPVQVTTTTNGQTSNSISYVDAGIKLKYTPRINADGMITATVHTEVSTPTLVSQMNAYTIATREADTTVRLHDGQTLVIGGLIDNEESGGNNHIPLLGDLPLLKALFSSTHTSKTKTEVIIFLTAHIVKDDPTPVSDDTTLLKDDPKPVSSPPKTKADKGSGK